jgi:hypothetical protein
MDRLTDLLVTSGILATVSVIATIVLRQGRPRLLVAIGCLVTIALVLHALEDRASRAGTFFRDEGPVWLLVAGTIIPVWVTLAAVEYSSRRAWTGLVQSVVGFVAGLLSSYLVLIPLFLLWVLLATLGVRS